MPFVFSVFSRHTYYTIISKVAKESFGIFVNIRKRSLSFSHWKKAKNMSLPTACCTLSPVESSYVPKGSNSVLGDLTIYEIGEKNCENVLICMYDIFGFHPTTKQFCDKLASTNTFRVVMPDFFRGKPFPIENFPPKDRSEIMDFVATIGSWDNVVKNDLPKLLEHYKTQGAKKFGIFGFCWGSRVCVEATAELSNDIKAAVLLHPAFVTIDEVDKVKSPTLLIPTKDESDFVPFYEKLKAKFGEEGCGHHRFEDMHHGFAAARGNMDDELNRKRVDEALSLVHHFFKKNLEK